MLCVCSLPPMPLMYLSNWYFKPTYASSVNLIFWSGWPSLTTCCREKIKLRLSLPPTNFIWWPLFLLGETLENHSLFTFFTCDFIDICDIYHKLSSQLARLRIPYLFRLSLHGSWSMFFIKLSSSALFSEKRQPYVCTVPKIQMKLWFVTRSFSVFS